MIAAATVAMAVAFEVDLVRSLGKRRQSDIVLRTRDFTTSCPLLVHCFDMCHLSGHTPRPRPSAARSVTPAPIQAIETHHDIRCSPRYHDTIMVECCIPSVVPMTFAWLTVARNGSCDVPPGAPPVPRAMHLTACGMGDRVDLRYSWTHTASAHELLRVLIIPGPRSDFFVYEM
nr:hypothetical protein CFP56_77364 [Quercus suber]